MLEKIAVREMLAQYKSWNNAEQEARDEDAMRQTPEENLRDFVGLCDFCSGFQTEPMPVEPREEWIAYYERVARFEAWRLNHVTGT